MKDCLPCLNQGECNYKKGFCDCKEGWGSDDCSIRTCPGYKGPNQP